MPILSHFGPGVPGLYAAGTITHNLDFRKSAGGFIHGFRYTSRAKRGETKAVLRSRALFRLLEERNFGVPWAQEEWQLPLSGGSET